jgi:hypothetical protein
MSVGQGIGVGVTVCVTLIQPSPRGSGTVWIGQGVADGAESSVEAPAGETRTAVALDEKTIDVMSSVTTSRASAPAQ